MAGTLYIVATPLGNLEDITLRALRVLKEVDLVAAEDTRHSRKLLAHYGIRTRLVSYHDHVERDRAPQLVRDLEAGRAIALISDAGTPGISDPGYRLVRAAIDAGVRVVPIPGASAVATALCASGLPTDRFVFEGFLPARSGQRRKRLAELAAEERTIVLYETARRLSACLSDIEDIFGARDIVVARELTKMFEEFVRGPICDVLRQLNERPVRGEVTLLVAGRSGERVAKPIADLSTAIEQLRREGMSLKDIAHVLACERGVSRREVYRLGLNLRKSDNGHGSV